MTFYHVGAFGVLGIEDSLAYPEFLEGTNLAQQSLSTRIFKVGPVVWLGLTQAQARRKGRFEVEGTWYPEFEATGLAARGHCSANDAAALSNMAVLLTSC